MAANSCLGCSDCPQLDPHDWRNLCHECGCSVDLHDSYDGKELSLIRSALDIKPRSKEAESGEYLWTPAGLTKQQVDRFMANINENERPRKDNRQWRRQLHKQLPVSDFVLEYNSCLKTVEQVTAYRRYVQDRDMNACAVGTAVMIDNDSKKCAGCDNSIAKGEIGVQTELSEEAVWHVKCFRCDECQELLAELIHCYDDGDLYCVRHFGDLDYHRCKACDQLIFASQYTKSKGAYYHMDHYCCTQCNNPLTGKRYVLRQDQPTCLPCYEEKFANKCEKCEKAIGTDYKDLSYKGRHWHEACFLCWGCQNSLANQQFVAKDDGLYCPDCYDSKFAQRCDVCSNTFKHGMQKFEYNGKKFHHECFTCNECANPIGNNSFVPKDEGRLICMPCYNDKFAQKCSKCGEVLLQGGVTFREVAYHRECFLCTGCSTELANIKFATKDEQPYCPDCYVKNFAKICEKCEKPIAGLGQATKYVAFEGRQWHADCFMCGQCEKSLLGQGFLVCNNLVVCPDCGKNM